MSQRHNCKINGLRRFALPILNTTCIIGLFLEIDNIMHWSIIVQFTPELIKNHMHEQS